MTIDLFAGIPVSDYARSVRYEQLLGSEPSFLPNDIEAVWEVAENRYLYIEVRPEQAGHARNTLFVSVRRTTFHDPDGNEVCYGGAPLEQT